MLDPPVPQSAFFNLGFTFGNVEFQHPLIPGSLDPANWFVRWLNRSRFVDAALVAPGNPLAVAFTTSGSGVDVGPDVVSYSPPPFDVISATARAVPAPAFSDFPLDPP